MKVVVESWSRANRRLVPKVRRTALKLGRFLGIKDKRVEIMLVDKSFMNKNVWSFPAPKRFPGPKKGGSSLGEVYLNPAYIKKEGEALEYMLIHGLLHLLGYDHKRENDIMRMENLERKLLQKLEGSR